MDHRLDLEMTLSREEFLRLLPGAVGPVREVRDGVFRGGGEGRRWSVRLVDLPDLRAGSLALRRHRIEIRLEGYPDAEADAFLARFQRGFQRGGG